MKSSSSKIDNSYFFRRRNKLQEFVVTNFDATFFTEVSITSVQQFSFNELIKRVLQSGIFYRNIQRKKHLFLFISATINRFNQSEYNQTYIYKNNLRRGISIQINPAKLLFKSSVIDGIIRLKTPPPVLLCPVRI